MTDEYTTQSDYTTTGTTGDATADGGGVAGTAQEIAGRARTVATDVADRLPGAVSTAQTAVSGTAQQLEQLPEQTLMLGAAFSLGLGLGMFLSGTNRMLVSVALAPAAAMAATLWQRENRRTFGG